MTSPTLLIAEREFRTYVATLSFWLSLAIAPLAAGGALFFSGNQQQAPILAFVVGQDQVLVRSATLALAEAGRLEGRVFLAGQGGAKLTLAKPTPMALDLTFSPDFPLSPTGRVMVAHVIERDAARNAAPNTPLVVRELITPTAAVADAGLLSRLLSMMMLWLTLVGSLGMLLQAVVRERANRALESLLAAAQGWQIVLGKMLGVGAVSLMVLVTWGGTAAALSLFAGKSGVLSAIAAGFSDPFMLTRDALIYICAYAFYGAMTVMLGALARDNASAQNVARPMFVLLLLGFLAALASVSGQSSFMSWLVYVLPFTPFLLLTNSQTDVAILSQTFLMVSLLLTAFGMILLAARCLSFDRVNSHIFRRKTGSTQLMV